MIFLETERVQLRRFTLEDTDRMIELNGDAAVMRYLTGKAEPADNVRNGVMPRLVSEYERHGGLGSWAGFERAEGAFIGWYMLRPPADAPPGTVEVGYRLPRSAWGKGYATEVARALVRKAFEDFAAERVVGNAMAINQGSRHVLEKAGLKLVRLHHPEFPEHVEGSEHGDVEYALTREEWEARGR